MELSKLTLALKALGVTEKECFVLWSIIAAIYHLGYAGAVRGDYSFFLIIINSIIKDVIYLI